LRLLPRGSRHHVTALVAMAAVLALLVTTARYLAVPAGLLAVATAYRRSQ
jgi:hypothetical protein